MPPADRTPTGEERYPRVARRGLSKAGNEFRKISPAAVRTWRALAERPTSRPPTRPLIGPRTRTEDASRSSYALVAYTARASRHAPRGEGGKSSLYFASQLRLRPIGRRARTSPKPVLCGLLHQPSRTRTQSRPPVARKEDVPSPSSPAPVQSSTTMQSPHPLTTAVPRIALPVDASHRPCPSTRPDPSPLVLSRVPATSEAQPVIMPYDRALGNKLALPAGAHAPSVSFAGSRSHWCAARARAGKNRGQSCP